MKIKFDGAFYDECTAETKLEELIEDKTQEIQTKLEYEIMKDSDCLMHLAVQWDDINQYGIFPTYTIDELIEPLVGDYASMRSFIQEIIQSNIIDMDANVRYDANGDLEHVTSDELENEARENIGAIVEYFLRGEITGNLVSSIEVDELQEEYDTLSNLNELYEYAEVYGLDYEEF